MKPFNPVPKFRQKLQTSTVCRSSQRGFTIVEYAVGAALIAVSVLVAFGALGNGISTVLNTIVVGIG